jgi:hypothetical protein
MRKLSYLFGVVAALTLAAAVAQADWSWGWGQCGCATRSPYAAPSCMSPTYGYYAPGCCPCVAPSCCDHIWDGYCFERRCCWPKACVSTGCVGAPAASTGCADSASGAVEPKSAGTQVEVAPRPAPTVGQP